MNKQTEVTLGIFANEETTVQNKFVWVPDYSFKCAREPKRIEIDIIKQWIIDNNYNRSYLLNLIDTAIKEVEGDK